MENLNVQNNFFEVKDQYIAALLFSLKIQLSSIRREGNVVFFNFKNKEQCEKTIQKYYQNKLMVNPKEYSDGLMTVKRLIFSNK